MNSKDPPADPLAYPASLLFGLEASQRGYLLNQLCRSMRDAANRAAFVADEAGYMRGMGLSESQQALVRRRDWFGLQEAGANQYALVKLAGTVGVTLIQEGAVLRDESVADFLATRPLNRGKA
ncbi:MULTISPECIES: protocatechuate 3,4-dioxygenase [Polaromonas]|uniref:Protocatechuate 3,4-dioxygenase n=1 Tax=Polaromonas aquatica TaxID=332657 RepID=A0ABW1U4K1_9BURK